jgi:acetoin utilization protein AcuB
MYIKDHMTRNPITVTKDVSLTQATNIMGTNKFHRLPVVDDKGHLIGLVTGGLVEESSGARNTSLSIYELNYLLNRTKVEDIMIKDVVTIGPDEFLEEAALRMENHGISVLPVVDEENKVIGIITEKDIFKAFVDLMGYTIQGTRFVIKVEDKPGVFAKLCGLFAQEDANLESVAVYHNSERGTEAMVKATGEVSVERMQQVLEDGGFTLVDILQITKEGTTKHYPVQ